MPSCSQAILLLYLGRPERAGAQGADIQCTALGVMAPSWPRPSWFGGTRTALGTSLCTSQLPQAAPWIPSLNNAGILVPGYCHKASRTEPQLGQLSAPPPLHTGQFLDVNKVSSLQEPTFPPQPQTRETLESLGMVSQIPHHTVSGRRNEPSHSLITTAGNCGCVKKLVPAPV